MGFLKVLSCSDNELVRIKSHIDIQRQFIILAEIPGTNRPDKAPLLRFYSFIFKPEFNLFGQRAGERLDGGHIVLGKLAKGSVDKIGSDVRIHGTFSA